MTKNSINCLKHLIVLTQYYTILLRRYTYTTFSPPTVSFWQIPTIHHILGVYFVKCSNSSSSAKQIVKICAQATIQGLDFDSFNEQKKVVPLKASTTLCWVEKLFTTLPIKCFDHSQKPLNWQSSTNRKWARMMMLKLKSWLRLALWDGCCCGGGGIIIMTSHWSLNCRNFDRHKQWVG